MTALRLARLDGVALLVPLGVEGGGGGLQDGPELGAVATLACGDDDGEGLLPLLAGEVELGGQAAAGPAERVVGGHGAARLAGRLLLRGAVLPGPSGVLVRPRGAGVEGNVPGHMLRRRPRRPAAR